MSKRISARWLAGALAIPFAAVPASATERHWNNADSSWNGPGNWSPTGVPGTSDLAFLDRFAGTFGGTARLNTASISAISELWILNSNMLVIDAFGSLQISGDSFIGRINTGTVNLLNGNPIQFYGGTINDVNTMRLGVLSGAGAVNQNAGTVSVGTLILGDSTDQSDTRIGTGTYNISGGLLSAGAIYVGGSNNIGFNNTIGGYGQFNLSGSGVINTVQLDVGDQPGFMASGTGAFAQTGGQLHSTLTEIGTAAALLAQSTYTITAGSFQSGITLVNRSGLLNFNGGSISAGQIGVTFGGHVVLKAGAHVVVNVTTAFADLGAFIDMNDNTMLLSAGSLSLIRSELRRGYSGATWTGSGIMSSVAAASASSAHPLALGYTSAGPDNVNMIRLTYYGDADMDGDADGVDIGAWATNFTGELGGGPTATKAWSQGDWDYDGDVDGVDAGLWATDFTGELGGGGLGSVVVDDPSISPQAAQILRGLGLTVVPEPVGALPAAVGLAVFCGRRRAGRRD